MQCTLEFSPWAPTKFKCDCINSRVWSLFCAKNATSVFSSTFSKQKIIPQSPYAFSFCPTHIHWSAYSFPQSTVYSSTVSIQFSSVNNFQFDCQHSVLLSQQFLARPSGFSFSQPTVFSSTVSIQFFSANSF